jgi:hypothetical protein
MRAGFGQTALAQILAPACGGSDIHEGASPNRRASMVQDDSARFPDRYLNVNPDTAGVAAVSIRQGVQAHQ